MHHQKRTQIFYTENGKAERVDKMEITRGDRFVNMKLYVGAEIVTLILNLTSAQKDLENLEVHRTCNDPNCNKINHLYLVPRNASDIETNTQSGSVQV